MGRITLTLFAMICLIAATRGADGEEFVGQRENKDDHTESLRYKRDFYNNDIDSFVQENGLPVFVIAIIVVVVLIFPICICCCCCCCACCPCYHWCHPNNTNVTIIQPTPGFPGATAQNYFDRHGPSESASSQDPPPQYSRKGYDRLSTPAECV